MQMTKKVIAVNKPSINNRIQSDMNNTMANGVRHGQ